MKQVLLGCIVWCFLINTTQAENPKYEKGTFAAGCFWCVEQAFDGIDGVISTTSGYIGGTTANPTYPQVSKGRTGHTEAVEVVYDPDKVTYMQLLEVFWVNHDPTVNDRQFCDKGNQYRPGIFTHDAIQQQEAEKSKMALQMKNKVSPILTEITPATTFYPAEEYHQDYYLKNPVRYKFYKHVCGREQRLKELWGKALH